MYFLWKKKLFFKVKCEFIIIQQGVAIIFLNKNILKKTSGWNSRSVLYSGQSLQFASHVTFLTMFDEWLLAVYLFINGLANTPRQEDITGLLPSDGNSTPGW